MAYAAGYAIPLIALCTIPSALSVLSGFVRYVITEDTANWSKSRPVSSSTRPGSTKALKQIPGIDIMLGPMAEQFFYVENIASSVLVGEKQLPQFHQLLLEACQTLELDTAVVCTSAPGSQCLYVCCTRQTTVYCLAHL